MAWVSHHLTFFKVQRTNCSISYHTDLDPTYYFIIDIFIKKSRRGFPMSKRVKYKNSIQRYRFFEKLKIE